MKLLILIGLFGLTAGRANAGTLDGEWRQDCLSGNSRLEKFNGSGVLYEEHYFFDRECSRPAFHFRIPGTFRLNGGFDIDFRSARHEVVLEVPAVVVDFNRREVCGFRDWTLGRPRVVSGLSCDFFHWGHAMNVPSAGISLYGIWKMENGRLYLGLLTPERDGSSPTRRPTTWNARFFRKID